MAKLHFTMVQPQMSVDSLPRRTLYSVRNNSNLVIYIKNAVCLWLSLGFWQVKVTHCWSSSVKPDPVGSVLSNGTSLHGLVVALFFKMPLTGRGAAIPSQTSLAPLKKRFINALPGVIWLSVSFVCGNRKPKCHAEIQIIQIWLNLGLEYQI